MIKHSIMIAVLLLTACTLPDQQQPNSLPSSNWNSSIARNGTGLYSTSKFGTIFFKIPSSWKSSHVRNSLNGTETIKFEPVSGKSFMLLIDPLISKYLDLNVDPDERNRTLVRNRGRVLLTQAKETSLEILEIKGVESACYYYTLEDRSPKPGEWPFLTQGRINIGEYCLNFTILAHSSDSPEKEQALDMLTTCKYSKVSL